MADKKENFRTWIREEYEKWAPPEGYKKNRLSFAAWIGVAPQSVTIWLDIGASPNLNNRKKLIDRFGLTPEIQNIFVEKSLPDDLTIKELEIRAWFTEKYDQWSPAVGSIKTHKTFAQWLGVSETAVRNWLRLGCIQKPKVVQIISKKLGNEIYGFLEEEGCISNIRYPKKTKDSFRQIIFIKWVIDQYRLWIPEIGIAKSLSNFSCWLGFGRDTVRDWLSNEVIPTPTSINILEQKMNTKAPQSGAITVFDEKTQDYKQNKFAGWVMKNYESWRPEAGAEKSLESFSLWLGVNEQTIVYWLTMGTKPNAPTLLIISKKLGQDVFDNFEPTSAKRKNTSNDNLGYRIWINEKYENWTPDNGVAKNKKNFAKWLGVSEFQVRFWCKHGTIPMPDSQRKVAEKLGNDVYKFQIVPRPYKHVDENLDSSIIQNPEFHTWINEKYTNWTPEIGTQKTRENFAKWLGVGEFIVRYGCTFGHVPHLAIKHIISKKLGDDIYRFTTGTRPIRPEIKEPSDDQTSNPFALWFFDKYKTWQPEKGQTKTIEHFSTYLGLSVNTARNLFTATGKPWPRTLEILSQKFGKENIEQFFKPIPPSKARFSQFLLTRYEQWTQAAGITETYSEYGKYGKWLGLKTPYLVRDWILEGTKPGIENQELLYRKLGEEVLQFFDQTK